MQGECQQNMSTKRGTKYFQTIKVLVWKWISYVHYEPFKTREYFISFLQGMEHVQMISQDNRQDKWKV